MAFRNWIPTLVNYFSTMKDLDNQIEEIRTELCQNPNFIPRLLFDSIDLDQKNYITLNDFRLYLNNHFLPFEEQCLRRLIHNFDKDKDFSIDFEEFLGLVLTKFNLSVANNISNRKIINENYRIESSIETSFIKLLKLELNLVKILSKIADHLKYSKDFTTYEAFLAITKGEKYITSENLRAFLNDCDVNVHNNTFNLMSRLDSDGDGKISYEEFIDIFFPFKEDYKDSDVILNKEKSNNYTVNDSSYHNINNNIIINNSNFSDIDNNNNIKNDNIDDEEITINKINPTFLKQTNSNKINMSNYPENNKNIDDKKTKIRETYQMIKSTRLKNKNNNYNYINRFDRGNNKLNSPRRIGCNACGYIEKLTQSPLHFDYKKGINNKVRTLSMDNSLGETFDDSINIQTFRKGNLLSSPININKSNTMKQNLNNSNYFFPEREDSYISKLRTYTSPLKNNNIYNNSNIINNNISNSFRTRSPNKIYSLNNIDNCNLSQEEIYLSDLLLDIINQEKNIESNKLNLSYCNDANLINLFNFFDYSQRNQISQIDLIQSLKKVNLFISNEDANIIFNKYDKNYDNKLDYEEFCDMILPKNYSKAKIMSERESPLNFSGFSQETKNKISNVFQSIINGEKSNENYRRKLFSLPCFNPCNLYNIINRNCCPGIYKEDFVCLLEKNNKFIQPYENEILIDRFDKNNDGIINYNEFIDEITLKMKCNLFVSKGFFFIIFIFFFLDKKTLLMLYK